MARKNIHPKSNVVQIIAAHGETFNTRSTIGVAKILLENDITTHPAWRLDGKSTYVNESVNSITKFRKKRGAINFAAIAINKE